MTNWSSIILINMPSYQPAIRILSSTSNKSLRWQNVIQRNISMTTPALSGHRIERDTFGKWAISFDSTCETMELNFFSIQPKKLYNKYLVMIRWAPSSQREVLWGSNSQISNELPHWRQNGRKNASSGHKGFWSIEKSISYCKQRIRTGPKSIRGHMSSRWSSDWWQSVRWAFSLR